MNWVKKSKGNAKVYTHPEAFEGRAIVQNSHGIVFNGQKYGSLEEAKAAALSGKNGGTDAC